ncbi:uncharacterized protein BDZ83DRAFT_608738 [Colletotrichum acutatum]|uniref:Uncharacterized protein n=1 Tax=Glomerella acutata TaxID=27357 RepID=A0AAD8UQA0_GLOAC|nr:uncharacterized protein BDZ83DRAFT_608738 [Colletotrichum acutatum]KAK1728642.1 hypothetical protein BDZ83DRAFT_608738 [Colletotrichum acutatum]
MGGYSRTVGRFVGFRSRRGPPTLSGSLGADIEKNGLEMDPSEKNNSNFASHSSGSISEDTSDFKKPTTTLLAATLILLGSSTLDLYAMLRQSQPELEKAPPEDGGFAVEAQPPDGKWYRMLNESLGENMRLKAIHILSRPSPEVLILGLVAYGAGASTLYHLNHREKYRDTMLAGGILLGFCVGIAWELDGQSILLRILPWTVLVALSLSNARIQIYGTSNSRPQSSWCSST